MSAPDYPSHPIDLDLHPPVGGRVIATFTYPDPDSKSAELESEIGDVKTEIGDVSNEIGELRTEVSEIKQNVTKLHSEIGGIRSDIALPRSELQDVHDLITNFGAVIRDLRDDLGKLSHKVGTLQQEVRDVAVDMRVQKKTATTVAWATGATMLLALLLLLMLGWNVRNNIDNQVRTALDTQQRSADSTAKSLDAAKLSVEEQIAASRELYLLTVRELDRFGSLNPQMQNRLIAALSVNAQMSGENEPELGAYVTERSQDILALLRPTAAERVSSRRPIEAVVRLNRTATEVAALLLVLRRSGSDVWSCHHYFKPVDGLNKLQCAAVEPGRYDLSVVGFLNEDATRNPRPGYTVSAAIQVEEMPARNAVLQ
jgi:hypothetical protein